MLETQKAGAIARTGLFIRQLLALGGQFFFVLFAA